MTLPTDIEQRIADAPQHTRELYQAVDFGMEVQGFVNSRVGQHLIQRAEQETAEAMEQLKDVNPFMPEAIRELQNKIWRAENVQFWMAEAIQSGLDAQRQLMEQETDT